MLFNSQPFLLLFLPVVLAGFFLLGRRSPAAAAWWLAAASLFFYGYWNPRFLPLLLASVVLNYRLGVLLRSRPSRRWLAAGVAANLLALGWFKYAGFLAASAHLPVPDIVLPVGISFFTFTQIAFLVDTCEGKAREGRFAHYLLFVTYFPHLVAGPVLHHKEMMPQFAKPAIYRPRALDFAVGVTIFVAGLAKKVLIADNLAPYANAVFNHCGGPSLLLAWGGVLAYAFQLYFDFSGYSDMAIGLSRLFGVRLPLNFASPYKAATISDFWRCWHMTLSRFLRDYLYVPLGGNRHGKTRRYANLMVTMLLGGLWHGAGWNFVIWGGLHGIYLAIHHAWTALRLPLGQRAATALTFIGVCYAWVFFRAPDLHAALAYVAGMSGANGVALPDAFGSRFGGLLPLMERWGITFYGGGGSQFIDTWSAVAAAAAIVFLCPNTQQIMARFAPALDCRTQRASRLAWAPTRAWGAAIGVIALLDLLSLNRPSDFLYFQF
ncbi:MAG TPA: MBOAT family protein [Burkholderiaceae bacterium]|nr:MBOAT family protein [Burkholderiaceae bacterium]